MISSLIRAFHSKLTSWNVSTATYTSLSKLVSAQESSAYAIAFSPDGTKMFIMGVVNNTVYQYTLSTPWNVSTATYTSLSKSISAQESHPYALAFSTDGTKMFIVGIGTNTVYQYTLSTPWNVSTATYTSLSKLVSAQESSVYDLAFSPDGTKMFIMGITNDTVYQYTLSTPWNVSTATYTSLSKSISAQESHPYALAFSTDGTKMFIVGAVNNTVYQYTLSTPWNVSTATYTSLSKLVSVQDGQTRSLAFSTDGTKMFIMGAVNNTVYQYTL